MNNHRICAACDAPMIGTWISFKRDHVWFHIECYRAAKGIKIDTPNIKLAR